MRFIDQVAIVTGGASGIGLAAAKLFASEGAIVAINDVRADAAYQAVDEIARVGGTAFAIPGDVAEPEVVFDSVSQVMGLHGRIDILIANAGANFGAPAEQYSAWRRSIAINLDGMFFWAQAAARESMIPRQRGSIVFTSSLAGLAGIVGDVGYVASKHAIVGLTRALAAEWAVHGVRVNSVAPGFTDSLLVRQTVGRDPKAFAARVGRIPLGRIGQPEDQANAMAFLCSNDGAYITGLIMQVDGGQMAVHSGLTQSPARPGSVKPL